MSDEQPPEQPEDSRPLLRVVKGDATPEEVAAIVAVVASLQAPAPAPKRARPAWSHPSRSLRRPLAPGAGAWRASGLPG